MVFKILVLIHPYAAKFFIWTINFQRPYQFLRHQIFSRSLNFFITFLAFLCNTFFTECMSAFHSDWILKNFTTHWTLEMFSVNLFFYFKIINHKSIKLFNLLIQQRCWSFSHFQFSTCAERLELYTQSHRHQNHHFHPQKNHFCVLIFLLFLLP